MTVRKTRRTMESGKEVTTSTTSSLKKKESRSNNIEVIVAVLVAGRGLTHPCGTRLLPNDPVDIPFDNWTKAQMNAGLVVSTE